MIDPPHCNKVEHNQKHSRMSNYYYYFSDRPLPSPVDSLIATPDVDSIEVSWAESEEYLIGYRITWSDGLFENEILISDNDLTNYKINNLGEFLNTCPISSYSKIPFGLTEN